MGEGEEHQRFPSPSYSTSALGVPIQCGEVCNVLFWIVFESHYLPHIVSSRYKIVSFYPQFSCRRGLLHPKLARIWFFLSNKNDMSRARMISNTDHYGIYHE